MFKMQAADTNENVNETFPRLSTSAISRKPIIWNLLYIDFAVKRTSSIKTSAKSTFKLIFKPIGKSSDTTPQTDVPAIPDTTADGGNDAESNDPESKSPEKPKGKN